MSNDEYVFALSKMNSATGIYDLKGISLDSNFVHEFLDNNTHKVVRVEVFRFNGLEGPINMIDSVEELEEFLNEN